MKTSVTGVQRHVMCMAHTLVKGSSGQTFRFCCDAPALKLGSMQHMQSTAVGAMCRLLLSDPGGGGGLIWASARA